MKIISSLMITLAWSRSLPSMGSDRDLSESRLVESNQRELNGEPVKTLQNRIYYENAVKGNSLPVQPDNRPGEPTNKDLQIIMHSLFQRMDQLELKFKVSFFISNYIS